MATRYQKRISGPLMDRIDLHIDVPCVSFVKLTATQSGEKSASVRQRVEPTRDHQTILFKGTNLFYNPDMSTSEIRAYCKLDNASGQFMKSTTSQMSFNARAIHRNLKVARTISDLAGADQI